MTRSPPISPSTETPKTIAIGIITYKRPQGLEKLLHSLSKQVLPEPLSRYRWLVIVVDNDRLGENPPIVQHARDSYGLDIRLVEEPVEGIPSARNTCVAEALRLECDALVFVDDDEITPPGWLAAMLAMWEETAAAIITGPVRAILPEQSPAWAVKSRIYDKTRYWKRGAAVSRAYTNNTLVSKAVLAGLGEGFSMAFRYSGGSDIHYFARAARKGHAILWCPEAFLWEEVPPSRIKFSWILKRGFRSGAGDSISRRLIRPGAATVFYTLLLSAGRLAVGGMQMVSFPVTGWWGIMAGAKRFAGGAGAFMGIFGATYQEYKHMHGK